MAKTQSSKYPRQEPGGATTPGPAWTGHPTRSRRLLILPVLLIHFLVLQWFMPLRTAVQIGADEGFELAKATLCLKGYHLYTQIWCDQPPLHTFLITQALKRVSPSVLGPRLVTVAFSLLMLAALFVMAQRLSGALAASIAVFMLILSPGFLEL